MTRRFDIITFDCYGTLIDWEKGIRDAFQRAAQQHGVAIDAEKVVASYAPIEREVERERYRKYSEVLKESAIRVARTLGWALSRDDASFLPDSLPAWTPFPDTNPALERIRDAGYSLGILSNVDDDLLAETCRHFSVAFDIIVTAESVQSYKPAARHFTVARNQIVAQRWLHAAQSNFHDIVPANALGIPTAWINRKRSAPLPGGEPLMEFATLEEFADNFTSS